MRGVEVDRVAEGEMKNYLIRLHDIHSTNTSTIEGNYVRVKNFTSQYNSKIDNAFCTCKPKRKETGCFNTSRQIYRSQKYIARESKDIGISSVKTVYRKRVKRVYLPTSEERGTGSTDLSVHVRRRRRHHRGSNYELKKTSSKCVGGVVEDVKISVLDKKNSPIIQTISGSTSPKLSLYKNTEIFNNNSTKNDLKTKLIKENNTKVIVPINNEINIHTDNYKDTSKDCSSDSLVQHIHNLEHPSEEQLRTSNDFIENKLEKEYREMFSIKSNNERISDIKSASLLRRRFEALRNTLNKKECSRKEALPLKDSSKISNPSRRDVSIASDPPSLEARSYTNTKIHSPISSFTNNHNPTRFTKQEKTANMPIHNVNSEYQDVNGMFKLWEEKFNFEESTYERGSPHTSSYMKKHKNKVKLDVSTKESATKKKKEGRRFLFFGKKNKNKNTQPFRPKQGVTAGRCEVKDGFMIKIGNTNNNYAKEIRSKSNKNYEDYNISTNDWFKRYVNNKIGSHNSVRIRWNNNMYTKSSSTVFELMDCIYKNTGILLSSRSEITSGRASYYHSFTKPQVNFMQHSIQAWMIPKTITDIENINLVNSMKMVNPKKQDNKIEIKFPNKKWFIDKSQAFAQKIELILHSKSLLSSEKSESSEYIVIDIPQGYFSDTTSSEGRGAYHTSDEQVYNIVEYEAVKSNSYLEKNKNKKIELAEPRFHENTDCNTLKNYTGHQSANKNAHDNSVYAQKGDFISVGIITQTDIRDGKKPILKITDGVDDVSEHALPLPKTCEFAESFLQDYYRNWTPLGTNLLSWCMSDNKLCGPSEVNSVTSLNNQGDGSKSCSNIYDDYRASTIVSSCETSSCSHCIAFDEGKRTDDSKTTNFLSKLMKKNYEQSQQSSNEKRVWPKDSFEVYKRRKLYAASNKSRWGVGDDQCNSFFNKNEQQIVEQPTNEKLCCDLDQNIKKKCKKRVLLQDCDVMGEILKEQLSDKVVEGILSFKGAKGCENSKSSNSPTKQAQIIPTPTKEIPQPPCKDSCSEVKKPACSKKNSLNCDVPKPPPCPIGPPTPCQKPCPPTPPPCQIIPPCMKTPSRPTSPKIDSSSTQNIHRKPIPPRIHSPRLSSHKTSHSRPCICPKKKSPCNIPKCPVGNKSSSIPQPPASSSRQSVTKSHSRSSCNCCKTTSSEIMKKTSSNGFPWPLKRQLSNVPSTESKLRPKTNNPPPEKTSSKCITALKRLIQKFSSSSIKQKDCNPNCANRRVLQNLPPVDNSSSPPKSRSKMPGLHLKKLPMPKTFSKESRINNDGDGVIRLNSREKITIKLRQSTPSTEEIREGCNIKVQDEDGPTLYERCDYRKIDKNRMQFVKDMYRDSHVQVQRLSTPNIDTVLDEKPIQITEYKSDSTSNIIEINLNLKFKQGGKTTELNIKKDGDSLKSDPDRCILNNERKISKEIFVVQEKEADEDTEKRDVDIKIMIKNYKPPSKLLPTNKQSVSLSADDFCKKISEKFHTVSTGYSDVIERQTYSVHRATVDLSKSTDIKKSFSKVSVELSSKILTESIHNQTESKNAVIKQRLSSVQLSDKQFCLIKSNTEIHTSVEKTTSLKEKSTYSISAIDAYRYSDVINLEGTSFTRLKKYNREDKKKILKEIFENADGKGKDKSKMHGIRHLLRAVLTSDSSHEFNTETTKELSSSYLKLDYINDYVSQCNDKSSNSTKISSDYGSEVTYPTKEITSELSDSSAHDEMGCLCSHVAAKLNIDKNSCCCRKNKIDEEVICDLNDKHSCIDVETQYSIIGKNNSNQNLTEIEHACKNHTEDTVAYSDMVKSLSNSKNINDKELGEPSDILQLNETKKAVLEIYAEKTGKRHIAKLPKFIFDVGKQIYNYETIDNSKQSIVLFLKQ